MRQTTPPWIFLAMLDALMADTVDDLHEMMERHGTPERWIPGRISKLIQRGLITVDPNREGGGLAITHAGFAMLGM